MGIGRKAICIKRIIGLLHFEGAVEFYNCRYDILFIDKVSFDGTDVVIELHNGRQRLVFRSSQSISPILTFCLRKLMERASELELEFMAYDEENDTYYKAKGVKWWAHQLKKKDFENEKCPRCKRTMVVSREETITSTQPISRLIEVVYVDNKGELVKVEKELQKGLLVSGSAFLTCPKCGRGWLSEYCEEEWSGPERIERTIDN